MSGFIETIKRIAKESGLEIKDIDEIEYDDDTPPAYDLTLSGDSDSIEAFLDNNEEVANYTMYNCDRTDESGDTLVCYAPMKM